MTGVIDRGHGEWPSSGVNLPSLLTVGQVAGWKAMMLMASMVWLVAVAGGIAIG